MCELNPRFHVSLQDVSGVTLAVNGDPPVASLLARPLLGHLDVLFGEALEIKMLRFHSGYKAVEKSLFENKQQ